jgi:hypothetical protein
MADNLLAVAVGAALLVTVASSGRAIAVRLSSISATAIALTLVLWTVVRNLPGVGWLRPPS